MSFLYNVTTFSFTDIAINQLKEILSTLLWRQVVFFFLNARFSDICLKLGSSWTAGHRAWICSKHFDSFGNRPSRSRRTTSLHSVVSLNYEAKITVSRFYRIAYWHLDQKTMKSPRVWRMLKIYPKFGPNANIFCLVVTPNCFQVRNINIRKLANCEATLTNNNNK